MQFKEYIIAQNNDCDNFDFSLCDNLVNYRQLQQNNTLQNITNFNSTENNLNLTFLLSNTISIQLNTFEVTFLQVDLSQIKNFVLSYQKNWTLEVSIDNETIENPANFLLIDTENSIQVLKIFNNKGEKIQINSSIISLDSSFNPNVIQLSFLKSLKPQRAILGTNNFFISILWKKDLFGVLLPYNLPQSDTSIILQSVSIKTRFEPINYIKEPFMSSFWDAHDKEIIAIPWIPFFSSCQHYGQQILLFEMLEYNNNCSKYHKSSAETITVQSIPTSGIFPKGDSCETEFQCRFEENVMKQSSQKKWWEIEQKQTLFYIAQESISAQSFISSRSNNQQNNLENSFQQLLEIESDALIPVEFISQGFKQGQIPNVVQLNIQYYQKSINEKQIVKGNVILQNYIETTIPHPYYTLKIKFKAMNYLDLVNSFQFGTAIYFFLFLIFGLIIIIAIQIFHFFNKMLSRQKNPPPLRIKSTFKLVFQPQIIGFIYSTFPLLILMIFVYLLYKGNFFDRIFYQYDVVEHPDENQQQLHKRGRLGLMFCIVSILIISFGTSNIIYKPSEEQEKQIIQTLKKKEKEQIALINENGEESKDQQENIENNQNKTLLSKQHTNETEGKQNNEQNKEDNDEEGDIQRYQIRKILSHKRYHYILVCIICSMFLIVFLEMSYSEKFKNYQEIFVVGFIAIEAISVNILQHVILNEMLLIAPIIGAFELIQFITVMAANSFQQFVVFYSIRLTLLICLRTYIDPILKNINFFMKRFATKLSTKHYLFEKLLKKYIKRFNDQNNVRLYVQEQGNSSQEEYSLEPMLTILLSYTIKAHSLFMRPLIILIIYIFPIENQIPKLYGLKTPHLRYYFLFSIIIIFAQIIVDIYVLNSLELLHGFKLFDIFSYYKFRFSISEDKWLSNAIQLNQSLNVQYRSLDNLLFSYQFFYISTSLIFGMSLLSIGMSIMIRNQYIFFADPVVIPMTLFLTLTVTLFRILIKTGVNQIFGFVKKEQKKLSKPLSTLREHFNNSDAISLEEMMENDLFKKHFVRYNKDWIIDNLHLIFTKDDFSSKDSQLMKLYEKLKIDQKNFEKDQKRKQMIKRKKQQIKQQNKKLQKITLGDDENNQLQIQENDLVEIKQSTMENIQKMMYLWLYSAKEIAYLRSIVNHILISHKENYCLWCNMDVELETLEMIPFTQIMKEFRVEIAGLPFICEDWENFYSKRMSFITLCIDCKFKFIQKLKQQMKNRLWIRRGLYWYKGNQQKNNERNIMNENEIIFSNILRKWLYYARSKLLHLNNNNSIEENENSQLGIQLK